MADGTKLRLAYISSWNMACGIATYTKHLVNSISALGYHVIAIPHNTAPKRCLQIIDKEQINIVNVQYEPILYPNFNGLVQLLVGLRQRGIKIIFTLHSEPDFIGRLDPYVDLFLYHRPPQLLQAKTTELPMGIPSYEPNSPREELRAQYGYKKQDIILATTGFAFSWKMFPHVLKAMVPYIKQDIKYKVQLIISNSDVNRQETTAQIAAVNNIRRKYSLESSVWVNSGAYIPQQELSDRLYISDLGYLWSGITTSSSSAAGKEFITSRLPVAITESSHYHDMQELAAVVTPMNISTFVTATFSLLDSLDSLDYCKSQIQKRYDLLNYQEYCKEFVDIYKRLL